MIVNQHGDIFLEITLKYCQLLVIICTQSDLPFAPAFQQIRDGSGNPIGTRTIVGDRHEYGDAHNNLVGQTNRDGPRNIIRDGSCNKIVQVDRDSDSDHD